MNIIEDLKKKILKAKLEGAPFCTVQKLQQQLDLQIEKNKIH